MKFAKQHLILPATLAALLFANLANAADPNAEANPQPCPVAPYGTLSMDDEFGPGAQDITLCNRVRHGAKVVVSVGHPYLIGANGTPVAPLSARFFGNLDHMVKNYEQVHGMEIGKDVEVAVVLLESGGLLARTQHPSWVSAANPDGNNPYRSQIEAAISKGIKVYLCQTAARSPTININMSNLIPGIMMVPGGHISVADFQLQGYALINLL